VLTFTVPGRPTTWKRTMTVGKRRPNDPVYVAAKGHVHQRALQARPNGWPLDQRYALGVIVHLANHRSEGDIDRYINLVMDALQGAMWRNDKQVDELLRCAKVFGEGEPRLVVTVDTVGEGA